MNSKISEANFKIGQRVVCFDVSTYNSNYPFCLDINKTYIIDDIQKCSCGETLLLLKNEIDFGSTKYCSICGNLMLYTNAYLAFRFKQSHLNIIR